MKDLNGCQHLNLVANNPVLRPLMNFANETVLKGVIHECPYGPGFIRVENASISGKSAANLAKIQRFANGDYKFDIGMKNSRDNNIMTISVTLTSSWRHNTLEGNEKF